MNVIEKLMITTGVGVIKNEFPAFAPAISEIESQIETGSATLPQIEQDVIDVARGAESLLPGEAKLIEDCIKAFTACAQVVTDLQARNTASAKA